MDYSKPVGEEMITKTIEALKTHGIDAMLVASGEDAMKKIVALIPQGSEVMTMTSVTLDTLGISKELNQSGRYAPVRTKFATVDDSMKRKLGAGPDFAIGSVHAVTEDGKVVIASNTGSQLPAYAYGAGHVIWVVGTQKITKNLDDAMKRLYEYVLPLESERAKKAYGVPGSNVSKILIINNEVAKARISLIFVPEALGF